MAAWSAVVDAILARAEAALPAVRIERGSGSTETYGDAVYVALQDIDDEGWTSAGTFRQSMQTFGGARREEGSVNCLVYATGGGDQAACTDRAAGYLAALEADIRADHTLGLTSFDYVVAQMDSGEIREDPTDGTSTALPFVISYDVRIT